MFAVFYKHAADFLAVLLTGCAVKMMDDYLDQDYDLLCGRRSLANRLGIGTVAYTMVVFAVSAALNWHISVALFFAAYMTGMVHEYKTRYISGLSGLQEICTMFLLSCLLVGMRSTLSSLFILLFTQIADDWLDVKKDARTGQRNLIVLLGCTEAWICGLLCLLLSLYLDSRLAVFVMMAAPLAVWLLRQLENKWISP